MRGCPAISYGWGRGHVRLHNRAFRASAWRRSRPLRPRSAAAVAAALAQGRTAIDFSGLPSAASLSSHEAELAQTAHAA